MQYILLNEINPKHSTIETILTNRGIELENIEQYLNTTDEHIHDYNLFGREKLEAAYNQLMVIIENDEDCLVIVDSDADGYTSSAILINYLYDNFPDWVENHLTYVMHDGKQHGLSDIEIPDNIKLVFVPDAGSNDYEEHYNFWNKTANKIIVLDHHEAEEDSKFAIVINNQLSDYPNKHLSGAGVTWQFCKFLDEKLNVNYADNYLDIVSLGLDFWANISFPAAAGVN